MNRKVPVALLSCFSIAFIVQGILKMCGVFVFEKFLGWQIFEIIDSSEVTMIIFYSICMFITMYCLSFTFTRHAYSKQWYHYLILFVFSFGVMTIKFLTNTATSIETTIIIDILYDLLVYVGVPLLIHFTMPKKDRLFQKYNVTRVVFMVMLQIMLYFLYLGLNFWSDLLNSTIPATQHFFYASSTFLIQLEVYIGLFALMFSMNAFIQNFIKGEDEMNKPLNIASDKAREEELKRVKERKETKRAK